MRAGKVGVCILYPVHRRSLHPAVIIKFEERKESQREGKVTSQVGNIKFWRGSGEGSERSQG